MSCNEVRSNTWNAVRSREQLSAAGPCAGAPRSHKDGAGDLMLFSESKLRYLSVLHLTAVFCKARVEDPPYYRRFKRSCSEANVRKTLSRHLQDVKKLHGKNLLVFMMKIHLKIKVEYCCSSSGAACMGLGSVRGCYAWGEPRGLLVISWFKLWRMQT